MVYTVKDLAEISGVSIRTLHYYDEIGLLKPAYTKANGYRCYENAQLLLLQQILFFRELGFDLKQIANILIQSDFDQVEALRSHRKFIERDLEKSRKLLETIDKTIKHLTGKKTMKDKELFDGFIEAYQLTDCSEALEGQTIEDLRKRVDLFAQYAGERTSKNHVDRNVIARDGASLRVRIYNDSLPASSPALIFFPGCAFVFDLFEVNGTFCSRIAEDAQIKVILVQFRLAPEHPLPTSLYDCYDAVSYIGGHASLFKIDPKKILLGGWASGAHCAAALSRLLSESKIKVLHQILLSGTFDLTESTHEWDREEKSDPTLKRTLLNYIAKNYLGISEKEYNNPLFSPYYGTNFKAFPPTTLLCGEFDAVRNDTEGYFRLLQKNGVNVRKKILKGQSHNTIALRKILTEGPDPAKIIAELIID